jgi:hypothetical protein
MTEARKKLTLEERKARKARRRAGKSITGRPGGSAHDRRKRRHLTGGAQ